MKDRLETFVSHALWDVVTEMHLLPRELTIKANELSTLFCDFSTKWLDFGMSLGVASAQKQTVTFCTKYAPRHTVKEMQYKVSLAVPDTRYSTPTTFI